MTVLLPGRLFITDDDETTQDVNQTQLCLRLLDEISDVTASDAITRQSSSTSGPSYFMPCLTISPLLTSSFN